jgi:diguanylate cyclase (GGDEF)-like protein
VRLVAPISGSTVAINPAFLPEPQSGPGAAAARAEAAVESYRRLAATFHDVLSEQDPDALLARIAHTLAELVPYEDLHIYEADEAKRQLVPVFARGEWSEEVLSSPVAYGQGITGWAVTHRTPVLSNQAHLDPRVSFVPGTPPDPEALITVPLIARGSLKGALNIYRVGEDASFDEDEFEIARSFGDAAALALDNAEIRTHLEHLAQTDSLTGLYNHRYFHERLRAELRRAGRAQDTVALLMLDIDDFKRVNDVCGHGEGDQVLQQLAEVIRFAARGSDTVCRVGGEEFAIILPSCTADDAVGLASRLQGALLHTPADAAGAITLSMGVAWAPRDAMNARELVACAETAMMTAKAQGKDRVVVFQGDDGERPAVQEDGRDARSIAHLKMLQSLTRKLNRRNEVGEIGEAIVDELRLLVDYHNCCVYLLEGDRLEPVAIRGNLEDTDVSLTLELGQGVTGYVALTGKPMLVPNSSESEHCLQVSESAGDESLAAVPLLYGQRVIGAIMISKLGVGQFDGEDLRLLEVLAGHVAVVLENARLYAAMRREAENARAWLEFADALSAAGSFDAMCTEAVARIVELLAVDQCSLWLEDRQTGEFACAAARGYDGDGVVEITEKRHSPRVGARFLEGRRTAFVVPSEQVREVFFANDDDVEVRALACAPLPAGHGVRGWIALRQPDDDISAFTEDRLRLLDGMAYRLSMALQRTALDRDQRESAHVANALLAFARALVAPEGPALVYDRMAEQTAETLGVPEATLWLQAERDGEIRAVAAYGVDGPLLDRLLAFTYSPEVGARFVDLPEPFVFRPTDHPDVPTFRDPDDEHVFAIAPFRFAGDRMGFLIAGAPGPDPFDDLKLKLLAGLADQAKLAI